MSDQEKLKELLGRIGNPDAAPLTPQEQVWLEEFRSRYPFFPLTAESPAVLCNPEVHARIDAEEDAKKFDDFYPSESQQSTPTTLDAIDDFLNTYGHQSPEEDELLEKLIFNPIPDYSQQLAAQESASLPSVPAPDADSQDARIDRFILSQKNVESTGASSPVPPVPPVSPVSPIQPVPDVPAVPPVPAVPAVPLVPAASSRTKPGSDAAKTEKPGLLSESLAKIYIKTHRYERAYEILNDLSLRFPEKSRYFADQLRFLRKLIQNEQQLRAEKAE